jgi:hypothetical protein
MSTGQETYNHWKHPNYLMSQKSELTILAGDMESPEKWSL